MEKVMYTFDVNLVSDLHKDAYGFRPSKDYMDMWDYGLTDEGRQMEWDYLIEKIDSELSAEKIREQLAVDYFIKQLGLVMRCGVDELTALRWMTQEENFTHAQDIEHWVWKQGILFTECGKKTLSDLEEIYKF
jgi:hypothetical protein